MENRLEERLPLQLSVAVNGTAARCVTRNISDWGMFVESDDIAIPATGVVSVALSDSRSGACSQPLRLRVVYHLAGGVGLMLYDRESRFNLSQFLQQVA